MRTFSGAPAGRELIVSLCAAGALVASACTQPQDASMPDAGAPVDQPIMETVAPTNGLVGEWKLDESGGTTAADSKSGYDATVSGGAAFIPGKLGNALDFNNGTAGTGTKFAAMPSNATLDAVQEGDYTLSAWFFAYSVPPNTGPDNRNWGIVAKPGQNMGLVYTNAQRFAARPNQGGDIMIDAVSANTNALNAWPNVAGGVSKSGG